YVPSFRECRPGKIERRESVVRYDVTMNDSRGLERDAHDGVAARSNPVVHRRRSDKAADGATPLQIAAHIHEEVRIVEAADNVAGGIDAHCTSGAGVWKIDGRIIDAGNGGSQGTIHRIFQPDSHESHHHLFVIHIRDSPSGQNKTGDYETNTHHR